MSYESFWLIALALLCGVVLGLRLSPSRAKLKRTQERFKKLGESSAQAQRSLEFQLNELRRQAVERDSGHLHAMEVEKEKVNNLVNELRHQAVEKDSSHVHEMAVEKEKINKLEKSNSDLRTILQETSEFYPTLAEIIADFAVLEEERVAQHLETKPHPAIASAEKVRAAARARRQAEQRFRVLKYQLSYYESVFPWIVELTGRSTKELLEDLELQLKSEEPSENVADGDPIRRWLAESEFARLSSAERSDLALSRWREFAFVEMAHWSRV